MSEILSKESFTKYYKGGGLCLHCGAEEVVADLDATIEALAEALRGQWHQEKTGEWVSEHQVASENRIPELDLLREKGWLS